LTNACPRGVLDVIGIIDTAIVRALPTELNQVIIRNRNTDIVLEFVTFGVSTQQRADIVSFCSL
jgi:molybdenum cofactor biosynthesis enzyme MoaA